MAYAPPHGPVTPTGPPTDLPVPLRDLDLLSIDPGAHSHAHSSLASSPTAPHFSHLAPPGRYTRHPGDFPPEIIALIIHHYYYAELPYPQHFPNPDPYLVLLPGNPWHPPRLAPPLDVQAKDTLAALCLVNKTWSAEATRALWRRVSFGMPRAFESVLRTIEEYSGGQRVARPLRSDLRRWTSLGGGSGSGSGSERSKSRGREPSASSSGHRATGSLGLIGLGSPGLAGADTPPAYSPLSLVDTAMDTSDVMTPMAEKQDQLQLGGPWAAAGAAVSPVVQQGAKSGEPVELTAGLGPSMFPTLPTLDPSESPLLFTRSISFARFRTAGMKRTLRQGSNERFVTPARLVTLLGGTRYPRQKLVFPAKREVEEEDEEDEEDSPWSESEAESDAGTPVGGGSKRKKHLGQLCQVGLSEYMDSAITFEVLQEVLFRGGYLAEYEEPDEPLFPELAHSSSESDLGVGLRSPFDPTPAMHLAPSPAEPFHYRHLGSSHSRSPSSDRGTIDGGRRRRSSSVSTSTSIAEEDETMAGDTDDEVTGSGARTPVGRRPAQWMQRRASGSRFTYGRSSTANSSQTNLEHALDGYSSTDDGSSGAEDHGRAAEGPSPGEGVDEDEPRGRERYGRGRVRFPQSQSSNGLSAALVGDAGAAVAGGIVGGDSSSRGRPRLGRPLLPPHLYTSSRSSSLPAPAHGQDQQQQSHAVGASGFAAAAAAASRSRARQLSMSRASERSSSVPASVTGRRGWAPEPAPKRTVQVLEGSLAVQPVRALDLCGCVSRVFVGDLEEFTKTYKLGPPALSVPSGMGGTMDTVGEEDEDDEMADFVNGSRTPSVRSMRMGWGVEERVLNRTFFPHLRRLGLASSLLPSELLTAFVLSFPYLTHLDLASTLTSPMLLKGLALAGQNGIGGRPMRLKALSLARCRLITGPALLGLFCGDCPPLTTLAGLSDDDDEMWGSGEVVSELTDLSLFGDGTYPNPLERPELRLVVSASPAFRSGCLRTLDLSSTPMTDELLLELMPAQPHLLELGLAHCRAISMQAVAGFLANKAPGVEVLDLSHSCPSLVGQGISSRRRVTLGQPTISIMELHAVLLSQCASLESSSSNPDEAQLLLALRATNLRVVELDEKSLELVQGGAGDWKPIPGKGRRGWYVDTATSSMLTPAHSPSSRPRSLVHLAPDHPQRQALLKLVQQKGAVSFEVGWHSRKLEVMRGDGLVGSRAEGLYSYHAYG
ncbi:hypothetical protein JCM3775_007421 [Rhodotorula graminis]